MMMNTKIAGENPFAKKDDEKKSEEKAPETAPAAEEKAPEAAPAEAPAAAPEQAPEQAEAAPADDAALQQEAQTIAQQMASEGLTGAVGEPLPETITPETHQWINDHLEEFAQMVSGAAPTQQPQPAQTAQQMAPQPNPVAASKRISGMNTAFERMTTTAAGFADEVRDAERWGGGADSPTPCAFCVQKGTRPKPTHWIVTQQTLPSAGRPVTKQQPLCDSCKIEVENGNYPGSISFKYVGPEGKKTAASSVDFAKELLAEAFGSEWTSVDARTQDHVAQWVVEQGDSIPFVVDKAWSEYNGDFALFATTRVRSGDIINEVLGEPGGVDWGTLGSRKQSVLLTNVRFEGGIGSNVIVGVDSSGATVRARVSDADAKALASVMTGDLGMNFDGVDIDASDIISDDVTASLSESKILATLASGKATLQEQQMLTDQLAALRASRREAVAASRSLDLTGDMIAAMNTPVPLFERHTASTDWLLGEGHGGSEDISGIVRQAAAQASAWFGRTAKEVREDRDEYLTQAEGQARLFAGRYASVWDSAYNSYMEHAAHLNRIANEVMPPAAEDPEQSGYADSAFTYPDGIGNPEKFDNFVPEAVDNAAEVASTRAPNVTASTTFPNVSSADEAREIAKSWNTEGMSWGELADWQGFFEDLVLKYPELADEFRENAITGSRRTTAADSPGDGMNHPSSWGSSWCAHKGWHEDGSCEECGEPGTKPKLILDENNRIKWTREKTASGNEDNGNAESSLDDVTPTSDNAGEQPAFPWEMQRGDGMVSGTGNPAGATDAAAVGDVPTPGQSVADYPQPKQSALDVFRANVQANLKKTAARSIAEIADEIYFDWKTVNYAAEPYLEAMFTLDSINDNYYAESGRAIVSYFLSNCAGWKGETAKRIKAELRALLKSA